MKNRFTRLLLIFAIAAASTGVLLTAPIVLGQEKKPPSSDPSLSPLLIKVFSRDGRESLTATCDPIGRINQVTCRFVHVRFNPPKERPGKTDIPLTKERFVEEALKIDPSLAEEARKNPTKFEQGWQELRKGLEELKQEFCRPKERVAIETKMREPESGPKRKDYYQS